MKFILIPVFLATLLVFQLAMQRSRKRRASRAGRMFALLCATALLFVPEHPLWFGVAWVVALVVAGGALAMVGD